MTKLTDDEQVTLNSYNKNATKWSAAHITPRYWGDDMEMFHKLLPKGRILEIGAGGGRDAKELIALGYDYVGTDVSPNLLEEARKNNPGAEFKQFSLYKLNFDEPFDGFWCAAVLLHIPKKRINEALQAIKRNVKADGIGFISIKEGEGERMNVGSDEEGGERFFALWQNNEFKKVLLENGFKIIREGHFPKSETTKWLTYHVRTEK